MRYGTQISAAELILIKHFGFEDMLKSDIGIHPLYRILCEKAFMDNDQSPYAYALRDAWRAVSLGKIKRMTPEFDQIIFANFPA